MRVKAPLRKSTSVKKPAACESLCVQMLLHVKAPVANIDPIAQFLVDSGHCNWPQFCTCRSRQHVQTCRHISRDMATKTNLQHFLKKIDHASDRGLPSGKLT